MGDGKLTTHPNEMATGGIVTDKQNEPFLCFQRRSAGDLLANEGLYKVCGSAQRRRRGALLQHGGVLLAQSQDAPELPGLTDLGAREGLSTDLLAESWGRNLSERLDLEFKDGTLSDDETSLAEQLTKKRFSCRSWIERR